VRKNMSAQFFDATERARLFHQLLKNDHMRMSFRIVDFSELTMPKICCVAV